MPLEMFLQVLATILRKRIRGSLRLWVCYGPGMPPAWPPDDYLTLLGRVVYSVASIEGLLLFDLPRMPNPPVGATPAALAGKTTTGLGRALVDVSSQVADPGWSAYLSAGAAALMDIGPVRNAVLHARPATVDGAQQLHRWRLGSNAEIFTVTSDRLCDVLEKIELHRKTLNCLRPSLRS